VPLEIAHSKPSPRCIRGLSDGPCAGHAPARPARRRPRSVPRNSSKPSNRYDTAQKVYHSRHGAAVGRARGTGQVPEGARPGEAGRCAGQGSDARRDPRGAGGRRQRSSGQRSLFIESTLVHLAARFDSIEATKLLVKNGIDVFRADGVTLSLSKRSQRCHLCCSVVPRALTRLLSLARGDSSGCPGGSRRV